VSVLFARTSDGADIAFSVMGDGPLLVRSLGWFTNLEMEDSSPIGARFWERLAQRFTVVRYDGRGMGLSSSYERGFSMATKLADLEAVVDAVAKGESVSMLGLSEGGATAVAYAAQSPQQVHALVLYGTFMKFGRGSDRSKRAREQHDAMVTLVEQGWGIDNPMFRQMFTATQMPTGDLEQIAYFDELQRASTSPPTAARFLRSVFEIDVSEAATQVRAPTLVMHRRGDQTIPWRWGQQLASQIPDAEFKMLGGDNHQVWVGDEPEVDAIVDAISEFIAPDANRAEHSGGSVRPPSRGVVTILFSDVEASTELTDRLGDVAARKLLGVHDDITREALLRHDGREIKTMGDGFMATFASASAAIECAIALQGELEKRFADQAAPLRVRIGLNSGEPIEEDDDLYGTAVIQAARVMGHAAGGEILVTDTVRSLVAGKTFQFEATGEHTLKGFDEPVRLWQIDWHNA
jgi:class 3 adenylate cyclase/predicted alpha/beta hydrolase